MYKSTISVVVLVITEANIVMERYECPNLNCSTNMGNSHLTLHNENKKWTGLGNVLCFENTILFLWSTQDTKLIELSYTS